MAITKKELIEYLDKLVELITEENKTETSVLKKTFTRGFESGYECHKEVKIEVCYLPPYYIAAVPE